MNEVTTATFSPPRVAGTPANHRYDWGASTGNQPATGGADTATPARAPRIPRVRRPADATAGMSSACRARVHQGCPDRLGATVGQSRCGCGCHRRAERLAYVFYGLAAGAAVIGQVWVAVEHIPWPPGWPMWVRVAVVAPFALCLELLGMVTSALADQRMRLGERALGLRAFSVTVAIVAVSVIVAGHWPDVYLVVGFGAFSGAAFLLWMLHSGARRRDALRAAGLLSRVAPAYGWLRWLPLVGRPGWRVTHRARELALEHGLELHESLAVAERELSDRARRPAIASAVKAVVAANHSDPLMAEIAVRTLDHDRIAAELERQADYAGWARRLAAAVSASPAPASLEEEPAAAMEPPQVGDLPDTDLGEKPDRSAEPARRRAARGSGARGRATRSRRGGQDTAARIANAMSRTPAPTKAAVARELGVSERTVYRHVNGADAQPG